MVKYLFNIKVLSHDGIAEFRACWKVGNERFTYIAIAGHMARSETGNLEAQKVITL